MSLECRALQGPSVAGALHEASEAQGGGHLELLVCGSRGYGPLRAVLLGGVSRRVVGGARCPVVVVPRGVEAALEALLVEAPASPPPSRAGRPRL